jgi:hypothetical protein
LKISFLFGYGGGSGGIMAFSGRRWTPGRRLRNNGALELLIVFKFLSKVLDSEREMTILYAVVARRILEKLPAEANSKLCFSQDSYILRLLRSDGLALPLRRTGKRE